MEKEQYKLDESSILELWVIARHLGINVDAISEKYLDAEAEELLSAIKVKLKETERLKTKLPAGLKGYCQRKSISLSN